MRLAAHNDLTVCVYREQLHDVGRHAVAVHPLSVRSRWGRHRAYAASPQPPADLP